jgi:hypothetical protein
LTCCSISHHWHHDIDIYCNQQFPVCGNVIKCSFSLLHNSVACLLSSDQTASQALSSYSSWHYIQNMSVELMLSDSQVFVWLRGE